MAIDVNSVIRDAENSLAKILTAKAVSGLLAALPWLSFLSGPLGFFVGLLVGQLVKYGDWTAYYLGDSWMNSAHASDYQKAGEALANLPPTASKEEIDAAKKAKDDAFDALMGA